MIGVIRHSTVKIAVPMILKLKWMIVALFALLSVPMDANIAVIHVPIFCPNNTNAASWKLIIPLNASACKIPTDAEDDWITAVKTIPAMIPINGFENLVIRLINGGYSRSGTIASPIIFIPTNKIPSPAMISPTNCTFSFFENTTSATPINAINGAKAPTSKAINCPVIVVPILAPMMIHTA